MKESSEGGEDGEAGFSSLSVSDMEISSQGWLSRRGGFEVEK